MNELNNQIISLVTGSSISCVGGNRGSAQGQIKNDLVLKMKLVVDPQVQQEKHYGN
jgi:hypothetical protein